MSHSIATAPALCEHGFEAALCADEQTPEVREAVAYAHSSTFAYAAAYVGTTDFPTLDAAESFATHVAREVARAEGLEGINLAREVVVWRGTLH